MNGTCHLSEVELVMCASFLVILKFLFDDPLSNFFHIHTGNGLEEVLENQETRKKIRSNENIVDETMVVDFYLYLPGCESLL